MEDAESFVNAHRNKYTVRDRSGEGELYSLLQICLSSLEGEGAESWL